MLGGASGLNVGSAGLGRRGCPAANAQADEEVLSASRRQGHRCRPSAAALELGRGCALPAALISVEAQPGGPRRIRRWRNARPSRAGVFRRV
jgi:hypothetical protein